MGRTRSGYQAERERRARAVASQGDRTVSQGGGTLPPQRLIVNESGVVIHSEGEGDRSRGPPHSPRRTPDPNQQNKQIGEAGTSNPRGKVHTTGDLHEDYLNLQIANERMKKRLAHLEQENNDITKALLVSSSCGTLPTHESSFMSTEPVNAIEGGRKRTRPPPRTSAGERSGRPIAINS
jgi:hypothetical protein